MKKLKVSRFVLIPIFLVSLALGMTTAYGFWYARIQSVGSTLSAESLLIEGSMDGTTWANVLPALFDDVSFPVGQTKTSTFWLKSTGAALANQKLAITGVCTITEGTGTGAGSENPIVPFFKITSFTRDGVDVMSEIDEVDGIPGLSIGDICAGVLETGPVIETSFVENTTLQYVLGITLDPAVMEFDDTIGDSVQLDFQFDAY